MKQSIALIIVSLLAITLGIVSLSVGLQRQEIYECNKWRSESRQLYNYYLTDWQKAQCEQYGI